MKNLSPYPGKHDPENWIEQYRLEAAPDPEIWTESRMLDCGLLSLVLENGAKMIV
jgi:hypothetical protein